MWSGATWLINIVTSLQSDGKMLSSMTGFRPSSGPVAYRGGWGVQTPPPPEIPKALQNCAKLNPIWENC